MKANASQYYQNARQVTNKKFFNKTYVLEFYQNNIAVDAFSFSVPCQSEEINMPQRINKTKTFGGTVIDDYGNDIVDINIAGSTINNSVKYIYNGGSASTQRRIEATGTDELFILAEKIKKYGEFSELKGKEVKLYDLGATGLQEKSAKVWSGSIEDFSIKRSKEMPLTYLYNLKFVATTSKMTFDLYKDEAKKKEWWEIFDEKIDDLIQSSQDFIKTLEGGLSWFEPANDILQSLKKSFKKLQAELDSYVNVAYDYVNSATGVVKDALSLGDTVLWDSLRKIVGVGHDLYSTAVDVNQSARGVVDWCINTFTGDSWKSYFEGVADTFGKTTEEIADIWTFEATKIEDNANEITATIKKEVDTKAQTVQPGTENEDDKTIQTYGHEEYVFNDGDNWDTIAKKYYGNENKGSVIASFNATNNKKIDVKEPKPGDVILIPKLDKPKGENNLANRVYNPAGVKDNLGKDIKLSVDNDFILNDGDYAIISGPDNLNQAITNRLQTVLGTKIRDEVYGIRTQVGGMQEANSLVLVSIKTTLEEEPRIASVDKIDFNTKSGVLNINVEYTDINGLHNSYTGGI